MGALRELRTDPPGLHACLVDAWGVGLLLCGPAGIGKSRLALELVRHGQALIADDLVEIDVENPHRLMGRCAHSFEGLLLVRGLGLLDIGRSFGPDAVAPQASIDLVIELCPDSPEIPDLLQAPRDTVALFGRRIDRISMRADGAAELVGRVEALCRDWRLRRSGHDPSRMLEDHAAPALLPAP